MRLRILRPTRILATTKLTFAALCIFFTVNADAGETLSYPDIVRRMKLEKSGE